MFLWAPHSPARKHGSIFPARLRRSSGNPFLFAGGYETMQIFLKNKYKNIQEAFLFRY